MYFQVEPTEAASQLQIWGAIGFGTIIGWLVYYINRYRKSDVQFSDLATVIGILGGGAILALFPAGTDLFGGYGIGLFVGFFSYFIFLMLWVRLSKNFTTDWFLDGRSKKLSEDEMSRNESAAQGGGGMAMGDHGNSGGRE
ncbi:MAG: hypothetical protein KC445_03255 [Anaerolineales bacterium]|nr:hypothetical protein [Anaerolineales bacterium]